MGIDFEALGKFISTVGFPIALTVGILLLILWVLKIIGRFLAPLITDLFATAIKMLREFFGKQMTMMDTLTTRMEEMPGLIHAAACRVPPEGMASAGEVQQVRNEVKAVEGKLDAIATTLSKLIKIEAMHGDDKK